MARPATLLDTPRLTHDDSVVALPPLLHYSYAVTIRGDSCWFRAEQRDPPVADLDKLGRTRGHQRRQGSLHDEDQQLPRILFDLLLFIRETDRKDERRSWTI